MNNQYSHDRKPKSSRVVLNTFGSLGDLYPFIALALELRARGHQPVIATHDFLRDKIESEGIHFHPVRPGQGDYKKNEAEAKGAYESGKGMEFIIREVFLANLRASYDDLTLVARDADLIVTHPYSFAGRIVAQKQEIAWASAALAPITCQLTHYKPIHNWADPVNELRRSVQELRREVGLPSPASDARFGGQFSPKLNLALFSSVLATPASDWPENTVITGFPFYEQSKSMDPAIKDFLDQGSPPIIFTLGSVGSVPSLSVFKMKALTDFYKSSVAIARCLGRRAILVINGSYSPPLKDVLICKYAPFSELFPRAAAIVHHGGTGTIALSLRAGRPMLILPWDLAQHDQATRMVNLGVARSLPMIHFNVERAVAELKELLSVDSYTQRAIESGRQIQAENGAQVACDALETLLGTRNFT